MLCYSCRRAVPTYPVTLYQNIGLIAAFRYRTLKGSLCTACITHYFWEYTLITLALGWWSFVSVFLTPLILINNLFYFVRARLRQPQSTLDASTLPLTTTPEPCPQCQAFQASDVQLSRGVWGSIVVSFLLLIWAGNLSLNIFQHVTSASNWIVVALFISINLFVALCLVMLVRHPLQQCTQCHLTWPKHTR